jgi:hypothetical protein
MSGSRVKAAAIEAVQLVPILVFAARFVVTGELDLAAAHAQFLVATAIAVPLKIALVATRQPLNPILLGVDAWLVMGTVGFELGVQPVAVAFDLFGPASLFFAIALIGVLLAPLPAGFIGGAPPTNPAAHRRASLVLTGLAVLALAWSVWLRDDIRLGGGVPFIALNVARRVMMRRLSRRS